MCSHILFGHLYYCVPTTYVYKMLLLKIVILLLDMKTKGQVKAFLR